MKNQKKEGEDYEKQGEKTYTDPVHGDVYDTSGLVIGRLAEIGTTLVPFFI